MASLRDLAGRVKQLFSNAGSNLNAWKQVATQPQLRQDYSRYVVKPAVQKWQAIPPNRLGSQVVGKTGVFGQGLAGFTQGMSAYITPKPIWQNIPQPKTFPEKAAKTVGGFAGFAMGPGKLVAPFETGVATKLGLNAVRGTPFAQRMLTKTIPALVAKNVASSAVISPVQSLLEGRNIKEVFKEQAGSSIAGEAILGPALSGALALGGIKFKIDASKILKYAPDIINANSWVKNYDLFTTPRIQMEVIDQLETLAKNVVPDLFKKTKKGELVDGETLRQIGSGVGGRRQRMEYLVKAMNDRLSYAKTYEPNIGMRTKTLTEAEHKANQPPTGGVGKEGIKSPRTSLLKQALNQPTEQMTISPRAIVSTNKPFAKIVSPPVKERGFVTSIKESANVSEPTKIKVAGTYTPKPNKQLMGEAQALLNEGASIKFNKVQNLDQKVAATIQEAINLDAKGNHEAAANLYNNLAEHGTELGRGVQAFSMLNKMSPEAIALSAARRIKQYNMTASKKIPELTGEQEKVISEMVKRIDVLPEGRERNIAINELQNKINSFIPSSIADKVITTWKAGLLTSLRTHERNIIGNAIMQGSEIAKDIPATISDWLLSQRTGQRTVTPTLRGIGEFGSKNTRQQVIDTFKLGYDPTQQVSKFEVKKINWGENPVEQALKKYTDVVFNALSTADRPYWNSAFARSLYDQAGAEALNAGRRGDVSFIENLVKNPTEKMLTTATAEANYATFKDENKLSGLANALKRYTNEKWYTRLPAEIIAPFTGVPSSIVGKTVAYSPLGLVKGAIDFGKVAINNIPELQRQASQEIGRGIMGTALFALGAYLMKKGLMTGQPKDVKESQQWQLEGKQANSVFINGKWRSINSVGPQNLIMLAGAKYAEEMGKKEGSLGAYAGGLAKDQLSQTFLAGVQGPLNAITDPARYGKSYLGNQTASVVPNIVKDTSKAFDPYARELNTSMDYMKLGIPGVRNTLLPKRDVLGNVVPQEPTGIKAFFDLFNSKTPIDNAVVNELSRLAEVGNSATPSKLSANQTIIKQKVKLTFGQLDQLEAGVGEALKPRLQALISSPSYQLLDDENKAKAIDRVVQDTRTQFKNTQGQNILGEGATKIKISGGTPKTDQSLIQYVVDENGNLKTIDLNPITEPKLTGNTELDKKLVSSYNSAINTQINGIVTLYKAGRISAKEAETKINELISTKKKTAKKPAKISAKKITLPKITIAKTKTTNIKIKAPPKPKKITVSKNKMKVKKVVYKIKKPAKIKMAIAKKGFLG